MNNKINLFLLILIPVLLLGIYQGISSFLLCMVGLTLCLLKSDKDSIGVFLLMFGGQLGGITRMYYPFLPIYGVLHRTGDRSLSRTIRQSSIHNLKTMPRQGRIQSGTGVYHVMLRRINHQNHIKAGVVSRVSEYEFTSWHEYLGREGFFSLCNVNVVLGRIRIDELTALIDAPLDNDVSCIEYEEERERSMSDDSVMLCPKDEFGITDGQQVQKLSKDERDVILAALLRIHAGVRQLQRLTGIGKNIISNVSKKLY